MNVKELIGHLQALDPEMMVVRAGYEGGVTEIVRVSVIQVALNVNEEWYYGEHEELDEFSHKEYPNAQRAFAVELT